MTQPWPPRGQQADRQLSFAEMPGVDVKDKADVTALSGSLATPVNARPIFPLTNSTLAYRLVVLPTCRELCRLYPLKTKPRALI
jgi:hypothetical protein